MKVFTSNSQKRGEVGENIACRYLVSKGYSIVERNYGKKWGEIDIVARRKDRIHLVEVKSVSCENKTGVRPEENMHRSKLRSLSRITQGYLSDKKIKGDWQWDLILIHLDEAGKRARVEIVENILLS